MGRCTYDTVTTQCHGRELVIKNFKDLNEYNSKINCIIYFKAK